MRRKTQMDVVFTSGVGDSVETDGGFTVSRSSRVHISTQSGGCGSIIPKKEIADKGKFLGQVRHDPIWCGMESESMPGHYFVCSECYGHNDEK
tara:strand:+ start:63 stop:341 length:279 start_codon:yes stop_codon:yes gene_type:complete